MRIGTWNLAGRWTPAHERFLHDLDCDVLLLTEVSERLSLPGFDAHLSATRMAPRRRWAGVLARSPLTPLPDPHPASALAVVDGWAFCSSILPWKGCGNRAPWAGAGHADRTVACVEKLLENLPTDRLVWGGDWNHALSAREWAGSIGGRAAIRGALEKLDLEVPTADLSNAIGGLLSIDHVAVPRGSASTATSHPATDGVRRLSDHDAYVVDLS